jgi:diadenosine tetraphosphate (Ap4A) HIT family hydrolase
MTNSLRDCVFCRIVVREEPASVLYEDDRVFAFLDVLPVNPGHTLVIPRRHGMSLGEMEAADGAAVFQAAQLIAAAIRRSGLKVEGVNLLMNDGAAAGQRVFHSHLHVIPRISGDSLRRDLNGATAPRSELEEVAKRIRDALVWDGPSHRSGLQAG